MDFINHYLPDNILHALGWTVVHSLWQAFIIALLLSAYLLATKADARQRYFAGFVALGATLLSATATFFILFDNAGFGVASELWSADGQLLGHYFTENKAANFQDWFNNNMPFIVTMWLMGMAFFILKMLGGLLYIQRLKTRHLIALPDCWQLLLQKIQQELGITKAIALQASALVKVPMVVGWLKPVVLMPIAAINNLSTQQVEAILAHELSHIARHDFVLNILQSIVEALFYFNPAVWWVSARIRTERENCCDDMAVALCGNSIAYAKALVSLQEMHQARPVLAMSFSKNKNQLLHRIQRILQSPDKKSNVMEKITATILLLAAVVILSVQANTDFDSFNQASNPGYFETLSANFRNLVNTPPTDTIPDENLHIRKQKDGEEVEVRMKNGEITYLKIDGKEIDAAEYAEYGDLVEELIASTPPPPPAPPVPPNPAVAPVPPIAPVAPEPAVFPTPPMPPAPPAPVNRTRTITTKKNGKGMTIIIETAPGEEPVEIEIENRRKGNVTINGNEITGLKNGDETVIVEDLGDGEANRFFFDKNLARAFVFPDMSELTEFPEQPFIELSEVLKLQELHEMPELERSFVFPEMSEYSRKLAEGQARLFEERFGEKQIKERELFERMIEVEAQHEGLFEQQRELMELRELENERSIQEKHKALERYRDERFRQRDEARSLLQEKGQLAELVEQLKKQQMALAKSESILDKEEAQRMMEEIQRSKELMNRQNEAARARIEKELYRKSRKAQ